MVSKLTDLFSERDHRGWLCVLDLDRDGEVSLGADEVVTGASTFKIAVALELFCRAASADIDLDEVLTFRAERFDSDQASLRDAAHMMMSASDNAATDALIDRLGVDSINTRLLAQGLTRTVVRPHIQDEVRAIIAELDPYARRAGFDSWLDLHAQREHLTAAQARSVRDLHIPDEVPSVGKGAPTTPRDMATLVKAIWTDSAGPATACALVRESMTSQSVQRLASAFPYRDDVIVAAKGGRIPGLVRNDVGVICLPEGRVAAAIFARANYPYANDETIDRTIGQAAATAIGHLTSTR